MRTLLANVVRAFRPLALAGLVLATGTAGAVFALKGVGPAAASPTRGEPEKDRAEAIRRDGPDAILVPAEITRRVGVATAPAAAAVKPVRLPPFQGVLAFDNDRLARVHARFAGEVVALGRPASAADRGPSAEPPPAPDRPLRVGDRVRAGDLLAVVWSKDLGEKKSELVDALTKLRADEVTLASLEGLQASGATSDRALRDARQAVANGRNVVARVERTLRVWRLSDAELAAVRAEADRPGGDTAAWARVEVRAPRDGVVLEKNVAVHDLVDTAADLFKIGDLSQLAVWAHVYEEDLPLLQALPTPVRWTVRLPARPGVSFAGTLDQVSAVIDPNQHTALATGRVENPAGDLKAGQFVTVSVELPAPPGELEVPAAAVVEDGRTSCVFVRDGGPTRYVRVPVTVTRRTRDAITVRGGEGLAAGRPVVTGGALLLRDAMDALPAPRAD